MTGGRARPEQRPAENLGALILSAGLWDARCPHLLLSGALELLTLGRDRAEEKEMVGKRRGMGLGK